MKLRRFFLSFAVLDAALMAVFLILLFTVFKEPAYVPFAAGGVSTLVPDGTHSSKRDGPWERHYFGGKGDLSIGIRRIAQFDLSELVRKNLSGRAEGAAPDTVPAGFPPSEGKTFDLGEIIRRARGDSAALKAGGREGKPSGGPVGEAAERGLSGGARGGPGGAMPLNDEESLRAEAARTYMQLLASHTPNLRLTQDLPAFDTTLFCLGSVGRGDRRYRYLVHTGDMIVDLHMHSPHSSHIVYKRMLDKALLNLRIDGQASNHLLAQAVADLNGRISPRWSQGNVFWLVFFVALPTVIMLILLPFVLRDVQRGDRTTGGIHPQSR